MIFTFFAKALSGLLPCLFGSAGFSDTVPDLPAVGVPHAWLSGAAWQGWHEGLTQISGICPLLANYIPEPTGLRLAVIAIVCVALWYQRRRFMRRTA